MKRSPMPPRRTPLQSGQPLRRTPLTNSSSSLLRSSRLRCVSRKRAAESRERTEVLRPLRESQPWCARCGRTGVGLDAHEIRSRARGGSITDLDNIVLLDRDCHRWVTENPAAAAAEGWAA